MKAKVLGDRGPSYRFYVEPYLTRRSLDRPLVVVVRYLSDEDTVALSQAVEAGSAAAYFMDDDLMDPLAHRDLPSSYRSKIKLFALTKRSTIEALCDQFWVSTKALAKKYASWNAMVLDPAPCKVDLTSEPSVWVCYHGTSSHAVEQQWLLPILRSCEAASGRLRFEIFGDRTVYKAFRALPRVNVLHPMTWPNYLDYTAGVRRDIALAPLLPSLFNAGRGPTKFFDHARMHAVGLYSDVEPYRSFVRDGVDGLLLPNDADRWVAAILELAADAPRRQRMAAAARDRAMALAY